MEEEILETDLDEMPTEKAARKAELESLESEWRLLRKNELGRMFGLIEQAYAAGMGVVEIKRSMGGRSVRGVLKTLVSAGLLENMPPATRKRFKLPENIRYGFERIGFPFEQWCHVNGFDPKEATAALQRDPLDPMPPTWKAVHETVSVDLPVAYADEYQVEPPEYTPGYRREIERPSLTIVWDSAKRWYCGSILENPKVETYGKTVDEVFYKLKDFCNIERQACRLEAALIRFESNKGIS